MNREQEEQRAVCAEDILDYCYDSLHYPKFITFWDNLDKFQRKDLLDDFDSVILEAITQGYNSCEQDSENVYQDGYDQGHNDGYQTASEEIVKELKKRIQVIENKWCANES